MTRDHIIDRIERNNNFDQSDSFDLDSLFNHLILNLNNLLECLKINNIKELKLEYLDFLIEKTDLEGLKIQEYLLKVVNYLNLKNYSIIMRVAYFENDMRKMFIENIKNEIFDPKKLPSKKDNTLSLNVYGHISKLQIDPAIVMAEFYNFQNITEISNIITSQFEISPNSFEKYFKSFCNYSAKLSEEIFRRLNEEEIKLKNSDKPNLDQIGRIELIIEGLTPDEKFFNLLKSKNFFYLNVPFFEKECFIEIELNIFFDSVIELHNLFTESETNSEKNPILKMQNLLDIRHDIVHRERYNIQYDLDRWLDPQTIENEIQETKTSTWFVMNFVNSLSLFIKFEHMCKSYNEKINKVLNSEKKFGKIMRDLIFTEMKYLI
jgi:hypothetical protein